ncbi:DUF1824 family protein [Cyanobacterium sp. IPPAS B-1200]|uniref:DUF1824 family protein n=1 Tax=Cyanobacterium sp. IPPAS B-1200 TaxID=1562720 RepID=UPI000852597B|nr:DUF1824 family protein [Cyanobacterium sp. IPPAS B-1200]OEJ78590.1 hypothetical protein A5482_01540 [Cyanobacterium sp. IPPAS B-1200]
MNSEVSSALQVLKEYSGIETKIPASEEKKVELQKSLLLIVAKADYFNLGVCASSYDEGFSALNSYLRAFDYVLDLSRDKVDSDVPIYIKFNGERLSKMVSDYSGDYRGVLITIFCDTDESILGTYGHLPLSLFD